MIYKSYFLVRNGYDWTRKLDLDGIENLYYEIPHSSTLWSCSIGLMNSISKYMVFFSAIQ